MKKYVNSDENKERIIELMREFKEKNNNPLVPLSFIKEKLESKELKHAINELEKDKLIHILSFSKYYNYMHKYPFDKLIEDIERKKYLFLDEDANDVYKSIVSKMFKAHEKSAFDMLKNYEKDNAYYFHMKTTIFSLLRNAGFSEHESHIISDDYVYKLIVSKMFEAHKKSAFAMLKKDEKDDTYYIHLKTVIFSLLRNAGFSEHESHIISNLFDIKIIKYILNNNIQNINIPLNIKMKVKILEYLYNKERKEEIEDYSYTTFKNSVIGLNKNDKSFTSSFSHTIGFLKQEEIIEIISVREDNPKNKNKYKNKKYVILKNDEEHFFKLLLNKFVLENHIENLNEEKNKENLLKIFEERVKVSKNSKTKIAPNIRYMIENLISKDNENSINNPEFAIYPRNEKVLNVEQ